MTPPTLTHTHHVLPFASALSETPWQALQHVAPRRALPHLGRLLTLLGPGQWHRGDEFSPTPPHEEILARALAWKPHDAAAGPGESAWPWAARTMRQDGLNPSNRAWGLLTPSHWHVGQEQISLIDPTLLALTEAESRELLAAVRPLFEDEGFEIQWGAPSRWYLAHDDLTNLPTASLDRAIGRPLDHWLQASPHLEGTPAQAMLRRIRRLQSEVQMLLYHHPLNQQREAQGALTINSFWLSGCGPEQAEHGVVEVAASLREPALQGDWAAWARAWQRLDESWIQPLLSAALAGAPVTLTLCGERHACTLQVPPEGIAWARRMGVQLSARLSGKLSARLGSFQAAAGLGSADTVAFLQSL